MTPEKQTLSPTREQLGEASVWMAMLRAADRTIAVERGLQRWLAERPEHTAAFEAISVAWEDTAALPKIPLVHLKPWQQAGFGKGYLQAAVAVVLLAVVAVIGFFIHANRAGVVTQIGEQRALTLEDGSRVVLNTASHLVVRYNEHVRRILFREGEALFDVARDTGRPFIVQVGTREIRALGTSFVVRVDREGGSPTTVTLIEGKLAVGKPSSRQTSATLLSPGERLTLAPGRAAQLDRPQVEKITAWRTGQVDLAGTRLADAAAEMNRYSRTQVVIEDPQTANILITGIFRAGDVTSFANAVAGTYDLTVRQQENTLLISGTAEAYVQGTPGNKLK
jgi:transmembrane sensor